MVMYINIQYMTLKELELYNKIHKCLMNKLHYF